MIDNFYIEYLGCQELSPMHVSSFNILFNCVLQLFVFLDPTNTDLKINFSAHVCFIKMKFMILTANCHCLFCQVNACLENKESLQ